MIKWTTPTLRCTIPEGLEYDYVILTLSQGSTTIEKRIEAADITDNEFSVTFTQTETGQFSRSNMYSKVEAQLNIINGDSRLATNIVELSIERNLHDEAI